MKNITFWGNSRGKSGTSGNMLAISTMAAVLYSLKTLLIQFDRESNPIHKAFETGGHAGVLHEEFSYYNRKGLDEILDKSKIKSIGKGEILDNAVNVKHTNLYYMPVSKKEEKEFDERFMKILLCGIREFESVNFIDCANGENHIQDILFHESDMIVVNLYQGMEELEELLENPIIREKALFVVGRYDNDSRESLGNIRRKYNIARDAIGVVPYNIHFHDSINEGKLVQFITKGIFSKKTDVDYEFIMSLYHTTNMILRKAGYEGI
ncbi:MAG: hypothetical protein SPF70_05005 [Lachnospiraceae bacterium]|nr:hypothetical protein [Lachnospiraceae bacterium]